MSTPRSPPALRENRSFLRYFVARAQSQFGTSLSDAALPLIAALSLQASARDLGSLIAASTAAQIVARLVASAPAEERRNRLIVLQAVEFGRFVSIGAVPALWLAGELNLALLFVSVVVTGLLTGCFGAFGGPYLVDLVSRRQLVRATGALSASGGIAEMAGPLATATLLRFVPLPLLLFVDAATYLVGGVLLHGLPTGAARSDQTPLATQDLPSGPRTSRRIDHVTSAIHGYTFVLRPQLFTPLLWMFLIAAPNGAVLAVLPIYATNVLDLSPSIFAGLLASGAVGGILGAAAAGRIASKTGIARALVIATALMAVSITLLPLAQPGWSALGSILAYQLLGSFGAALFLVTLMGAVPLLAPEGSVARAMTAAALAPEIGTALGALSGGFLAVTVGLKIMLTVVAATTVGTLALVHAGARRVDFSALDNAD